MSSDFGPAQFYAGFWKWFGVGIFCLLLTGGAIFGMWRLGWIFAQANANRQSHVIREGYENQQTLREQITAQISNVNDITVSIAQAAGDPAEVRALTGQRVSVVNIVCQDAGEVTGDPLPAGQQSWISSNCKNGVIRPGSTYAITGGN